MLKLKSFLKELGIESRLIGNVMESTEMLSQIPIKIEKVEREILDREILRVAMIAELDAINLYEQLAAATENENIRKVLLDVAKEEKTHMGEFQTLLLKEDMEQVEELERVRKKLRR